MFCVLSDYRTTAKANEDTFRKVLLDLKNNGKQRPMGVFIPDDLDTDSDIDKLYKKYSEGVRRDIFTILNFEKSSEDTASIAFQKVASTSGGGAILNYEIGEDGGVKFQGADSVFLS